MIKLIGVSKVYPRSGHALKDVSFHLRKGEFAFLTGHSGAGKSTIMRLLQMEERPTQGEVHIAGHSSERIRRAEIPLLRRKIGVVFQDFRLLRDRNVERNVAFAMEVTGAKPAAITPRVGRLLSQVGLAPKAQAYPDELSGGERQRVAIARALVNSPLVLLADEPTGNLDEAATHGVFQLFEEINAMGMTVLMATHDLELIRTHPRYRVIEVEHGSVVHDNAAVSEAER